MESYHPKLKVRFKVGYNTTWGQNVYVHGSIPELGDWDPRKGRKMTYSDPVQHTWELIFDLPDRCDVITYKYVILDDKQVNGGVPLLEPGLERTIKENSNNVIEMFDTWGEGPTLQQVPIPPKYRQGKLFRSAMPYSRFDPSQITYQEWKQAQIDIIVCLAYKGECQNRTSMDLLQKYGNDSYAVIYYPIEDLQTPKDLNTFSTLLARIEVLLNKGCNVVIHCHAGIGRTGIAIACLAKKYFNKQDVIGWVRSLIRGAVQTKSEEKFVTDFPC